METLFEAFGLKENIDKAFSDSFILYMHTITLASVSFQQENPKEFALAIIEGWRMSFAEMKGDFLEDKKDIMEDIYGKAFDKSLEEFTQTMRKVVESFPEEKQDIRTFFKPFKPKEVDSINPTGPESSDAG